MREWLCLLPGQSFFFTDEIPGWAPSLRSTLARIAADTDHPVVRVAHGFYCKRWHQDWPAEWKIDFVDTHLGGIHFAGAGAGAAEDVCARRHSQSTRRRGRDNRGFKAPSRTIIPGCSRQPSRPAEHLSRSVSAVSGTSRSSAQMVAQQLLKW